MIEGLTVRDWLAIGGFLGLASTIMIIVLQWMFCVRPLPVWALMLGVCSVSVVFARLINAGLQETPSPLDWYGVAAYSQFSVAVFIIALNRWASIIGKKGDRCHPEGTAPA